MATISSQNQNIIKTCIAEKLYQKGQKAAVKPGGSHSVCDAKMNEWKGKVDVWKKGAEKNKLGERALTAYYGYSAISNYRALQGTPAHQTRKRRNLKVEVMTASVKAVALPMASKLLPSPYKQIANFAVVGAESAVRLENAAEAPTGNSIGKRIQKGFEVGMYGLFVITAVGSAGTMILNRLTDPEHCTETPGLDSAFETTSYVMTAASVGLAALQSLGCIPTL